MEALAVEGVGEEHVEGEEKGEEEGRGEGEGGGREEGGGQGEGTRTRTTTTTKTTGGDDAQRHEPDLAVLETSEKRLAVKGTARHRRRRSTRYRV